jgi:hypothetical protein
MPAGRWSEMLRVNAYDYVQATEVLQEIGNLVESGWLLSSAPITPEAASRIRANLPALASHCKQLEQTVTEKMILNFLGRYSVLWSNSVPQPTIPTRGEAALEIRCIKKSFDAEIESRLFLFVLPHRTPYFSDGLMMGGEIQEIVESLESSWPNAIFDALEAGNCFAFERFTACVHHLAKVVEFGLVSFTAFAGVEEADRLNWNKALEKAHKNLREKQGNFAHVSHEDEQYYSEVLGLLRNFKTAWRNPSSHIPMIFEEPKAKALFSITKTTMQHLTKRFREIPMPSS